MVVSEKRFLVEWGDCDPANIVFYPRYLKWFDACTTGLFAAAGMPTSILFKTHGIVGVPLVDLKVRFMVPATIGDELIVKSTIVEWRKSSFKVRHQLFKGDELAVEGTETRVWAGIDPADPSRLKSRPIPPAVTQSFMR